MASVQSEVREYQQFIGGEWAEADGGGTFEDRDPFTGDVVANVPAGTRADAARAVAAPPRRSRRGRSRCPPNASGSS